MSLVSSNMAATTLGMTLSLLLLASGTQGTLLSQTVEAVVGQNVSLPCILISTGPPDLKIVSTLWRKNETTKLMLYAPDHGYNQFIPNVGLQIVINDANMLMGSYLQLHKVEKWDSGVYDCDITTFPFGPIRTTVELDIKGDTSPQTEFNVTVQTTITTHLRKDVVTVTPQYNAPEENPNTATDSLYTSSTVSPSTADNTVTSTEGIGDNVTADNPDPSGEPSSPDMHTDPHHSSTTVSDIVFSSTVETTSDAARNESLPRTQHPEGFSTRPESSTFGNSSENFGAKPTVSTGDTTVVNKTNGHGQRWKLLALIIVPVLMLIAAVGALYRRQMMKQRTDLPPPFKPPPPPVKYTATRRQNMSPQAFPISQCDSIKREDIPYQFIDNCTDIMLTE
ncbi:uncharacterized protein ACBR49_019290 [Aulostomus maculatus]